MLSKTVFIMRKNFTIILTLLFPLLILNANETAKPLYYRLKVKIEPASGEIFVNGKVGIQLENIKQRNFSFDLHETFIIEKLLVDGKVVKYLTEENEPLPVKPASKKVIVELPEKNIQKRIEMEIVYHGKLKNIPEFNTYENQELALDDQINSRMVELACYSCWYPLFTFGVRFNIDLELSLPSNWKYICSGKEIESRKVNNRIITRWNSGKDIDIVIIASPKFRYKTAKTSVATINVYFTRLPEEFVNREIQEIEETVKLFTEFLGEPVIPNGIIKHIYSPKRKGQGGAGIARPGMIVTSEGLTLESMKKNPNFSLFHGLSHEIAHFWWNFGAGQGDWINEAFAEYFSLVAVQKIDSQEEFENYLKKYKNYVNKLPEDAPSLSKVPFMNDEVTYIVRYFKGSLMLNYFRNLIGDANFFKICRDFYSKYHKTIIGTSEFRRFWGERLGEYRKALDIWLDSKGGLPELGNNERS